MNLENAKQMQTSMERDGLFEEIGGQPQRFSPDSFSKIEILPVGPDADQQGPLTVRD